VKFKAKSTLFLRIKRKEAKIHRTILIIRGWGHCPVAENGKHLHKALGSIPSTHTQKKET
jgi:hypothetical protein